MNFSSVPINQGKTLVNLLKEDIEILERGLCLVEEEIEIGPVKIDFLCVDPLKRPVLVYLVGGPAEEQECALRVMDGDSAFRKHLPFFKALFPGWGFNWNLPPRSIVVAEELSKRSLERFNALSSIDIDLFEIRDIKIKGEKVWSAVPVGGNAVKEALMPPDEVPETLEDPVSRELWVDVIQRVLKLDPDLEVIADKYSREITTKGISLAMMESGVQYFKVITPRKDGREEVAFDEIEVKDEESADRAVDMVIRRYLEIKEEEGRILGLGEDDKGNSDFLGEIEKAVEVSKVTDEELSAFLKDSENNKEME